MTMDDYSETIYPQYIALVMVSYNRYWKSTRTATIIWQPLGEMTNSKINLELLRASESIHESTPMKLMPVWKLCQSERCVNMKHSECQDMVQSEWNKWMHELMKRTKVPCRSAIILYFNTKWGISDICSSPWLYYTIFFQRRLWERVTAVERRWINSSG